MVSIEHGTCVNDVAQKMIIIVGCVIGDRATIKYEQYNDSHEMESAEHVVVAV